MADLSLPSPFLSKVRRTSMPTSTRTEATVRENLLADLDRDSIARGMLAAREALLVEHFADTPLALESIRRTGILPWPVEYQVMRDDDTFDQTFRIRELTRVVEYDRRTKDVVWIG